ncbi:MAG: guanylate kinase [Xanthomonadales bacterium]|jgi:guanylate kinase|nr:guanylate kinase [Xanthomonadales bacterium]
MSSESAERGQLFIVAAPSGAGKTSLVNALVADDPRLVISVSYTTREPRPGETDGVHYHFVTAGAFERRREAGEFLEDAEVFGHWYGTHRQTTEAILDAGQDVILEIDWQGARQVKESFPDCRSIFILPPSVEALRERLGARAQDSEAVIERRMAQARDELSHCEEFDFVVINDDFGEALDELKALIRHLRGEGDFSPVNCESLLAELLEIR